ncbi:MAG: amidohydrolase [Clostridia bacterium]|nr:amidohydrolase [Clostridia bacterium]
MLIDFHTHCFPDKLAVTAIPKLADIAKTEPYTNGTAADLIRKMDECGVERSVICNIATNPRQQEKVNNFAIELNLNPRFISLGSVHPASDCVVSELKRLKDSGIKGIKLHPDYMGYMIDDKDFEPIFGECSDLGLFVIIHAGFDVISPTLIHASPEKIRKVQDKFPELRLIAAHFGSNCMWDDVLRYLAGSRVYVDTSLPCGSQIEKPITERIIFEHDPERILFGSDTPWGCPGQTYDFIESLSISDEMKNRIYFKNALKLLGEE